jgi:hypothetical protein
MKKAKAKTKAKATKRKVSPIPKGYHSVTPYLSVRGGAAAIEFYKKAFGAKEITRAWLTARNRVLAFRRVGLRYLGCQRRGRKCSLHWPVAALRRRPPGRAPL